MRKLLIAISLFVLAAAPCRAQSAQDDIQKAIDADDYDKVVALASAELEKPSLTPKDEVWLRGERGFAYISLSRNKEAVEDLDYVIVHKDKLGTGAGAWLFYAMRGVGHAGLHEYDAAIADYKHALETAPDDPNIYEAMGDAYYGWGKPDEAIASYGEAIKRDPKDAEAFANRGENYENKQDFEHAVADYSEAIRIKPDYAMAYNDRGTALSRLKRYAEARADYDKSIALAPTVAVYLRNSADLHNDLGEWQAAIDDLEKASALDNDEDDKKAIAEAMEKARAGLAKKTP